VTHANHKLDVFLRYQSALIEVAAPIVGCRSRAEDVVQEAYLRFTAAGRERIEVLKPISYLYQIVRRLAMDWAISHARERPGMMDEEILDRLAAPAPSPEQIALYRQELGLVTEALAELPERTRRAFEMHRLGGYKLHEIANELSISVTLAHQLIHKALTHCANSLADDE
jgi:RNA polymerase sigma factor (sigma-70 family)